MKSRHKTYSGRRVQCLIFALEAFAVLVILLPGFFAARIRTAFNSQC